MMMIPIEPDELHSSCQHRKGVAERRQKSRERNCDLMGWAGTHEFIIKTSVLCQNNRNELRFNIERAESCCPHGCLSVIGFSARALSGVHSW